LYSSRQFTSLNQSAREIIVNQNIAKKTGTWAFYYNFDQYLYETKKGSGQGVGIFGRFGASDGNPNPVHYFYSIGIGGKGVIPGRPLDQFGIGYYYIDVSNPTFTGVFTTRSALSNEYGFEAYYNIALTPWMILAPNIQVIRPAQQDVVSITTGGVSRTSIDTTTVLGLRLQLVF
jgi:porin